MAIYHNSLSIIKRSAGRSSVAAAAYRSGQKLTDERTGIIHDYTRKSGVDKSIILTPINADWITDRAKLWNAVEAAERRGDARLAKEITLAIPVELSRDDKILLVSEYIQKNFVDSGMIADINYHDLESENPHAHIMVSTRDLKVDDKGEVTFGNKNRSWDDWNHTDLLVKNRSDWAIITNRYLVDAGFVDRQIDHRSNAARGIEAVPQIHLGFHVAAMRKKGLATERGNEYDRIEIANHNIRERLEQIFQSEEVTRNLEDELAQFDRQVTTDIEVTPEILKVSDRERKQRFYEKIESIQEVAKPPKPAYIKWSLKREIDPQLVRFVLEIGDRMGTDYEVGNYHVQMSEKEIEVRYMNNLAMIVDIGTNRALLIDSAFTLKQYESGLRKSINILMTEEQQRQVEPQLEEPEQRQPDLELCHDIIIDDSEISDDAELIIDDLKIETKPSVNQNISRSPRSEWNR